MGSAKREPKTSRPCSGSSSTVLSTTSDSRGFPVRSSPISTTPAKSCRWSIATATGKAARQRRVSRGAPSWRGFLACALDKNGQPVADTVRQENYLEDRFYLPIVRQVGLAKALAAAGTRRFKVETYSVASIPGIRARSNRSHFQALERQPLRRAVSASAGFGASHPPPTWSSSRCRNRSGKGTAPRCHDRS